MRKVRTLLPGPCVVLLTDRLRRLLREFELESNLELTEYLHHLQEEAENSALGIPKECFWIRLLQGFFYPVDCLWSKFIKALDALSEELGSNPQNAMLILDSLGEDDEGLFVIDIQSVAVLNQDDLDCLLDHSPDRLHFPHPLILRICTKGTSWLILS